MRRLFLILPLMILASCTDIPVAPDQVPRATEAYVQPAEEKVEPYSDKLRWMLQRSQFSEDPDVPCLAKRIERPAWVEDPAVRRRLREVQSDSFWLGDWARQNLGDRLAYARVGYDWEPGADGKFPSSPPPLVYQIAVTGSTPISPPPLRDRAKGIPIKIIYDVPYSHDEFMERRRVGSEVTRSVLNTVGEGGSPENGWAVRIDVYSEDGKPDPVALAQCDRLRRAYDLPIQMEFSSARATLD